MLAVTISQFFSFSLVNPLRTIFPKTFALCHYVEAFIDYTIASVGENEKNIASSLSSRNSTNTGFLSGPSGVWNRIQQSIEIIN